MKKQRKAPASESDLIKGKINFKKFLKIFLNLFPSLFLLGA